MYETERLIVRAFKPSDVDDLLTLDTDENRRLTDFAYNIPTTPKQALENFEQMAKAPNLFVVITHKDLVGSGSQSQQSSQEPVSPNAFMGWVLLRIVSQKNREGNIGIVIGKEWRGKGYGSEVLRWLVGFGFRQLGLHRISIGTFGINGRAEKLYKKL